MFAVSASFQRSEALRWKAPEEQEAPARIGAGFPVNANHEGHIPVDEVNVQEWPGGYDRVWERASHAKTWVMMERSNRANLASIAEDEGEGVLRSRGSLIWTWIATETEVESRNCWGG